MGSELLGVAGMVLVGVAITFETSRNLREKKKPDLWFALFYFLGSALLALYAFGMGEAIFLAINAYVAMLGLANMYPYFAGGRK